MNHDQIYSNITFLQSKGYTSRLDDFFRWVVIEGSTLPRFGVWTNAEGKHIESTSMLIDIPKEFPMIVPGVGFHPSHATHVPLLYFNGRRLSDTHDCSHKPWRWLCFEEIKWHPHTDNLITLLEIIEHSIGERARKTKR